MARGDATRRALLGWAAASLAGCARALTKAPPREPEAPEPAATVSIPPQAPATPAQASLFEGAPAAEDLLELLYSRRLSFDQGEPLITVRVAEGRTSLSLAPLGPLTVLARTATGETRPALAGGVASRGAWQLRLRDGAPGVGAAWVELEQVPYGDHERLEAARASWQAKGVRTRVAPVGDLYGIAGHVVDTRRHALLAEGDATEAGAEAQAQLLASRHGIRPQLFRTLASRPTGTVELLDPSGGVAASGAGVLDLRAAEGIAVDAVEYGQGYSFHGFERRTYPQRLLACVDARGLLALVAALPMERLVQGVVPSEIFPEAPAEALKAQAVTARGEVLAKIGARHLGDPYLLCAEQHCQVYKGVASERPGTTAATRATRGEALFRTEGAASRLVDSVYSAVCGGFTEDNDVVWGGAPDPSLRGRPDFDVHAPGLQAFARGVGEAHVAQFVRLTAVPSYCALSGKARADKVRWRRTFTDAELDALCAPLGVGTVRALVVEGRGVSGRARVLRVEGSSGGILRTERVRGELPIRRLFGNLNSGLFVVERSPGLWTFVGAGWGHGCGMCQTGAIGRAQRGASYREILGWYFSGAAPERIYG